MRIVRVSLALAVAFWMAGGGCMLGCENMATSAAASVTASPASSLTTVASGEACASMQSHSCCSKHGKKSASNSDAKSGAGARATARETTAAPAVMTQVGTTSSSMMECPLAVNATAALTKARPDQSNGAITLNPARDSLPNSREQATALASPPRLPNRGHTYLHCCVFLI